MVKKIKSVVEFVGLFPAILGFFKVTPQWFAPSSFYEPDILYWAVGLSVATFLGSYVYFLKVHGPVVGWTKDDKISHFKKACVGFALAACSAIAYVLVVRLAPHSSVAVDIAQQASWSGFFACVTFGVTALACIWKAP